MSLYDLELFLLNGIESLNDVETFIRSANESSSLKAKAQLVAAILNGRYNEVSECKEARFLFDFLSKVEDASEYSALKVDEQVSARVKQLLEQAEDRAFAEFRVLLIGAALLNAFAQANWTGPPTSGPAVFMSREVESACTPAIVQQLALDGEDFYGRARLAPVLLLARCVLLALQTHRAQAQCKSVSSWLLRYAILHQAMLESVPTLKKLYEQHSPLAIENFASLKEDSSRTARDVACQTLLECLRLAQTYWMWNEAKSLIARAEQALQMTTELTGVMGKRTKYQVEEKAQLVLIPRPSSLPPALAALAINDTDTDRNHDQGNRGTDQNTDQDTDQDTPTPSTVSSEPAPREQPAPASPEGLSLPRNLLLNSDVLLDQVQLDGRLMAMLSWPLTTTELAWLLAKCEHVKLSHPASHELTRLEMTAYIDRILADKNVNRSWAVYCNALLQRSAIECKERHRQERALLQFEELTLHCAAKVEPQEAARTAAYRVDRLYDVDHPTEANVKCFVADTFSKMGMYKNALDLYEEVEMWDKIIECCVLLGRQAKAEEMIRARLAIAPEPMLWCLLGDCTRDISHYDTAWELSKHRYPRAQRSLARHKLDQQQFAEAIKHYQLALDINPMFPQEWFAQGWCAIQVKDWQVAINAFNRTVSMEPEHGEAWNNLAASHLALKNKKPAFLALEQAVRLKFDSWKTWENYLHTAMDVGEVQKAMHAMERVCELKAADAHRNPLLAEAKLDDGVDRRADPVDTEILGYMADFVSEQAKLSPNAFEITRFMTMGGKITQWVSQNPDVWHHLARVQEVIGNKQLAIEYREKQCRALESKSWKDSVELFEKMVQAAEAATQAYVALPSGTNLYSAKLLLEGIIAKAEKSAALSGHEQIQTIKQLLDTVKDTPVLAGDALAAAANAKTSTSSSSTSTSTSASSSAVTSSSSASSGEPVWDAYLSSDLDLYR